MDSYAGRYIPILEHSLYLLSYIALAKFLLALADQNAEAFETLLGSLQLFALCRHFFYLDHMDWDKYITLY